ncbi:hypothetical protein NP233_g5528 [Leucocoprinus birnbaumii]|uniref:Uncharacterized protein n=1 Tax=Leucocoprinus birnbaumii TaxID=56174 RepID=A0AAD5VVC4_9AGAR|nr:hypothetical protein NP233_g5528 [Leucocoprinus birnbaumii]
MSACAACQGRSYITWSEWTANCPNVSSGFPEQLPTGLHVPGWAYLDPRPSGTFDQIRAQQNINLTESVFPPPATSSKVVSTSTKHQKPTSTTHHSSAASHNLTLTSSFTTASSTSTPESASASEPPDSRHANAIGGIAVGAAFVGLVLISTIIWLVHSRASKEKSRGDRLGSFVGEKDPEADYLEPGTPRIVVEAPEDATPVIQAQHEMHRYIEATAPPDSPSSSSFANTSLTSRSTSDPRKPDS